MNAFFETGLSFLLFLPTFAIVAALYCAFPRMPRGVARRVADLVVVVLAGTLSVLAMRWGFHAADTGGGPLWRQILATLLSYATFLAVLALALPLRARWLRRLRAEA